MTHNSFRSQRRTDTGQPAAQRRHTEPGWQVGTSHLCWPKEDRTCGSSRDLVRSPSATEERRSQQGLLGESPAPDVTQRLPGPSRLWRERQRDANDRVPRAASKAGSASSHRPPVTVRVKGMHGFRKGPLQGSRDRRQENDFQLTFRYTVHLQLYQSDSMFQGEKHHQEVDRPCAIF